MKPIFHPEAAEEFYAAVRQYAEIDSALAADFEAKVEGRAGIVGCGVMEGE